MTPIYPIKNQIVITQFTSYSQAIQLKQGVIFISSAKKAMPSIRRARISDLHQMQNCNLWCLPENYYFNFYLYHYLSWSELLYVTEQRGEICGYVLAKVDQQPQTNQLTAQVTSLSVLRTHRRLGLASQLMNYTHEAMEMTQQSEVVSLQVRVSNRAAVGLYRDRLGYQVANTEKGYYADGEDAHLMKKGLLRRGFPKQPSVDLPQT